ncbi:MAG: hypothetical protein JWP45_91 [Mucilaginibacter sp.]|nr:hypothetical protein [Mucilaginibacter sp.]
MNIINKLKRTKIKNNSDFSHCLFWFVDAVDDYFFNYDPEKESQIILMHSIIIKNLTDYNTNTESEKNEKQKLFGAFNETIDSFNFRKANPSI